jgi:deoxyribonuclease-4
MSFIADNNIEIGGHISFSKTLFPTVKKAIEENMKSIQFFMGNPKSFTRQRLTEKDINSCQKCSCDNKLNIFSHFPYTCSLVGSVASLAWTGDEVQDKKTSLILNELEYEINTLGKCCKNKCGVVIHPGSFKKRDEGLHCISKSINKLNFENSSKLLLENSAGEGSKLPRDFKELKTIFDNIDSTKKDNVGVCIDTAHIWGSGIYNLTKKDEVDKMFMEFDKYLGLDKFNLLHLNDSAVAFNSKKDRHECLTDGYIWKDDDYSLKYLIKKCSENDIPIILETPDVLHDLKIIDEF